MNVRYRVELSQTERAELMALLSGGRRAVRKLKRAQILLAADAGASDDDVAKLIGEVRKPIPAVPGQIERYDCEYKRNGTTNLFIFLDAHRPWRKVKVTDSRTALDFAACMRDLTDVHFPKAQRVRVVLDNLSAHSAGALYQAFAPDEARRVLRRLEFHYVPKHPAGSTWSKSRSACCAANVSTDASTVNSASSRNRRLGTTAQCLRSPYQMDVHNRKSPRQNGPYLSTNQRVIIPVQRY
jgi:hypothetical protein